MKDKIIPMIIIIGFASFFVNDEDSFYKWVSWCGTFVAISLLAFYIMGVFWLKKEYLDDEEAVKKFWDNVVDMCNRRGTTVTKLSLKLGKSPNHISNLKSQGINPTLVKIKNIAEALHIGITTLFKGIWKNFSLELHFATLSDTIKWY